MAPIFPSFTTATRIMMRSIALHFWLGSQHKRDNNGLNHELGILWIAPKSTMVRGLGKAVANNRAMIKQKPSLPANNKNLSSDNTLDYVGFWQQKALLHFTNSAYKGTFDCNESNNVWFFQYRLTHSYIYILAHIFCFVRHNIRAQIGLCQDPHYSGSVGD